ncbi:DUF1499 domain-containing protein [Deltaproteobacteria bacterium TL4]
MKKNSKRIVSVTSIAGRPNNLGVKEGKLAIGPLTPNYVSSQAKIAFQRVKPFRYQGSPEEAMKRLHDIISSMSEAEIIKNEDLYLYAEYTSKLMRFVDDLEFYLDEREKVIHVRSASRLGLSDFGANRRRVETIRKHFDQN